MYFFLYSGGEPLLRAGDIVTLAATPRLHFCAFTNATLVTPELAQQLAEAGNVMLAISVEGFAETMTSRRGGSYAHVVRARTLREAEWPSILRLLPPAITPQKWHPSSLGCHDRERLLLWLVLHVYSPGAKRRSRAHCQAEQRQLMYEKVRRACC